MPGIIVPALLATGTAKSLTKAADDFILKVVCHLKGSCSPKFVEAINKTGGPRGYRRYSADGKDWWMFLSDTQHLSWFPDQPNYQGKWYKGSGYWDELRRAGLDKCCLKSTLPPSEAFPPHPDGVPFGGLITVKVGGFETQCDKVSYDPAIHVFSTGNVVPSDSSKDVPKEPVPAQASEAGLGSLIMPAIGLYIATQGGRS